MEEQLLFPDFWSGFIVLLVSGLWDGCEVVIDQ